MVFVRQIGHCSAQFLWDYMKSQMNKHWTLTRRHHLEGG